MLYKAYVYVRDGSQYETLVTARSRADASGKALAELVNMQDAILNHPSYSMADDDTKRFASAEAAVEVYEADPAYTSDPGYIAQYPRLRTSGGRDFEKVENQAGDILARPAWYGVMRYDHLTGLCIGWFTSERHTKVNATALAAHYQKYSPYDDKGRLVDYYAQPITEDSNY